MPVPIRREMAIGLLPEEGPPVPGIRYQRVYLPAVDDYLSIAPSLRSYLTAAKRLEAFADRWNPFA